MKKCFVFFFLILFMFPAPSFAQLTLTRDQALDFGEFVIRNFSLIGSITVDPMTGDANYNGNIIPIIEAERGEYSVSGGPPSSLFAVTVTGDFLTLGGTGDDPSFNVLGYTTSPLILQTDPLGNDTFSLGATLTTQGLGTVYNNGVYTESVSVTVQF